MGILNVTPDSFSDGGRLLAGDRPDLPAILAAAEEMIAEGAAILDVGGESTRPGAGTVPEDVECRRVLPVVERLLELDAIVSVDTSKAGVARRALGLGCHMINDVRGLRGTGMLEVLAESDAAACVMHMLGEPGTMQEAPRYADVVAEVRDFLGARAAACNSAGIDDSRLLLDPGFGFGKTLAHNLDLLRHLPQLRVRDLPLAVGVSRKRMIGTLTGRAVEQRVVGSAVTAALAVGNGANVVRVHDVAATVDALKIVQALD